MTMQASFRSKMIWTLIAPHLPGVFAGHDNPTEDSQTMIVGLLEKSAVPLPELLEAITDVQREYLSKIN